MVFLVQNDSGTIAGANAYVTVTEFKDYHKDRGNTVPSGGASTIQGWIIKATDYLDSRFRWVGDRRGTRQRTAWPRIDAEDINQFVRGGVPAEVKEACSEYALIAATQALNPSPDRDSTGRAVTSKREMVGPIEESTQYTGGSPFLLPEYPVADDRLFASGLVVRGIILRRA